MSRSLLLCLLSIVCCAGEAAAQPAVEIRSAFGASNYLHGDIPYIAPTVLVAARFGRGPLAVEPEFAVAWDQETQTFAINTSTTSSDRFQSVGVNLIGRSPGRVSAYGGGGVGLYSEHWTYRVDSPQFGDAQSGTRGPRLGAQAVAGVDFTLASHVKAFGQFRYETRSFEDPGGGSVVQGFAGVAIVLR